MTLALEVKHDLRSVLFSSTLACSSLALQSPSSLCTEQSLLLCPVKQPQAQKLGSVSRAAGMPQGILCTGGTQAVAKAAGSLSLRGTSSLGVGLSVESQNGIFGTSSPVPPALCGVVSPPPTHPAPRGALQEWAELCFPLQSILILLLG